MVALALPDHIPMKSDGNCGAGEAGAGVGEVGDSGVTLPQAVTRHIRRKHPSARNRLTRVM